MSEILKLIRHHREEQVVRAICAALGAYKTATSGVAAPPARPDQPSRTARKRSHRR